MSLRRRLSLAFAGIAAVVAATVAIVVYERSAADRDQRARSAEVDRARVAASIYKATERLVLGATLDDPTAPAPLRAAASRRHVASYRDDAGPQPMVWAAAPVPGRPEAVLVRSSFAEEARALRDLRGQLVAVGTGATLAGALLGLLLATWLSARLRSAAAVARRVAGGDLTARIDARGRDEVAVLGAAVDSMAQTLGERIERERRFSADVAHELRTPVAGLVAAADLLPPGEASDMVREDAARLRSLVDDLLEVARLESGAERAEVRTFDLATFVTEVAAPFPARVLCLESATVESDPRRLGRALVNLLENARRHGAPPIEIEVAAPCIAVRDHGPGFPHTLLDHATERFTTGEPARGGAVGLGLAIAAGQVDVLGGSLQLSNCDGGGAIVTISLPRHNSVVIGSE